MCKTSVLAFLISGNDLGISIRSGHELNGHQACDYNDGSRCC